MPLIQVSLIEGRTAEQKENLINRITDAVAETLDSPASAVRVIINEVKPENWGIAGETMKAKRLRENGRPDESQ